MKKKTAERILVALLACAVCVGVTSCGDDSAEQSAPQASVPQVPASQEQSASSTQSSAEPAAAVPQAASVTASFESLVRLAQRPEADYVASARAWAGNNFMHKRDVCDIALRNRRMTDLVTLTRDARAACSGADATFKSFYAIAEYFKACGSFDEAREALKQARKLVGTAKQLDNVADLLRSMQ
jgi:glucose/arabinose dehydrogenase